MPAARRPAAPSGARRVTAEHGAVGERGGSGGERREVAAPATQRREAAQQHPSGSTPVPARTGGAQPARAVPRPATPRTSVPRPAAPRVRSTPSSTPRSTTSRPAARPDGSGGRGGSGGGRGGPGGRAESVQQRVPRLFTVRALVMLIVLSIAFVLVFPTLRQYLDQQVQLEQLRAEVAAAEQDNDDLQAELDRWSDPAYVEAQARERLAFVMPGERALRVSDPEVVPEETTGTDTSTGVAVEADPTRPWYAQIWDSVQVAGAAGTGAAVDEESAGTGDNGSASTGDATDGATPSSTP